MFHFDRGLKITGAGLSVDICRRQPRGFISHAHADHMGPHELAFCTPQTAALYRHRMGAHRDVRQMPYGETLILGDTQLTALPAGHVFGAAMLYAQNSEQTLLYTGDFRLRDSLTAGRAELRRADVLVMETTFGRPEYRFPDRDRSWAQLLDILEAARRDRRTPVIRAYSLGKSQEVTRLLTGEGYRVMQHEKTLAISRLYESLGCPLGEGVERYDRQRCEALTGEPLVVLAPPRRQRGGYLELPPRRCEIAVTGWAISRQAKWRLRVQHAIPISDHADYDELLECIERVAPKRIYCTHGERWFCDHLRELGRDARVLGDETYQQRLFA